MKLGFRSSVSLLMMAFMGGPVSSSAETLTWLGDLPGGFDRSFALGISADGSTVVGESFSGAGNRLEAFVWSATGGMQGLDDQSESGFSSSAHGVNADGSRVVGSRRASVGGANTLFVWEPILGLQEVAGQPNGTNASAASEISDDGSTVAVAVSSDSGEEAFIWGPSIGFHGLGFLPGGAFYSYPSGVSSDGEVVVGVGNSNSGSQAFVWDGQNGMRSLSDLVGTNLLSSYATDVSADGTFVVGGVWTGSEFQAFRWDAAAGLVTLGIPSGNFQQTWARDVSDDGAFVVGRAEGPSGSGTAFVWHESFGILSLESLLIARGLDLTGIELDQATGISADGSKIVGFGRNANSSSEAFMVTLPEPSFAAMLVFGVLMLSQCTGQKGRA